MLSCQVIPGAVLDKELCIKLGVTFKLEVHANWFDVTSDANMEDRYHAVQEFNKGVYDYIIAADEGGGEQDGEDSEGSDAAEQSEEERCTFLRIF